MIKSRIKYFYGIIKRKSLSCHHLQGRRLPRSGTTQSLKEEKYSLAVAKSLAGGSWENCKNWPTFAGADSGKYPWPVRFWKNSFTVLLSLKNIQSVMNHEILFFGISRKAQSPERKNLHIAQFPKTKGQLLFLP